MKQGDIYLGKPEGLAQWRTYPISVRLIEQVLEPIYANQGDWVVEVSKPTQRPSDLIIKTRQVWTEAQIRHIFKV
jgi:hypothetical protein